MNRSRERFRCCFGLLLLAQASFAQPVPASLQQQLATFTKAEIPEKLFLHTDKETYVAGDIVWFKLYAVDGVFNRPFAMSKVAYVEIMDRSNTAVARASISLTEKGGDGSFQLPFSLRSDRYLLRAYTNWMKNEGASLFFEKELAIINTLKSPDAAQEKPTPSYSIGLFPEGGNLVNALPSKIAFRVADKSGKGVGGKGWLLNSKNDTLTAFAPFKFGMGDFKLTPQSGETYRVIFKTDDGSTVSQAVPTAYANGYGLQLEEAGDRLKLTVRSSAPSNNSEIYLLAQTRQQVKAVQTSRLANGSTVFLLDKKELGQGVSQLTIFNSEKKPLCERLYFIQPALSKEVKLQAAKEAYARREKVEYNIASPLTGTENLSVSVYQLDELQSGGGANIDHYLWLTSELNGRVENPGYYFSARNEDVQQAADYLMRTNGWRRFRWEAALGSPPVLKFPVERSGQLITGRVTKTQTGEVAKGVQVYLSIPDTKYKLYTAVSDSEGLVQFEVRDYYGPGQVVVQPYAQDNIAYKVEILSPFAETGTATSLAPLFLTPSFQSALVNYSIGMQAQNIYRPDSLRRFLLPRLSDTLPFYGAALASYNLDDFVRFNTMEEVLREYVREISVGVKGSGASLRFKLLNQTERNLYTDGILVTVDGIPLADANASFELDPLKIKRLDVIAKDYVVGNAFYHGLANFTSYTSHYEGLPLDPSAVTIDYEGLQLQREFYSPDYSTAAQRSSRLPDLRTTLYWQPNLSSKQFAFYTGDNKCRYAVVLQGITADGQPISTTAQFDVKE